MARTKQRLINYHTSNATTVPSIDDVQLGEIVVRHATDKPELLIKKDSNAFATFIDSESIDGKLATLKSDLEGQIDSLESATTGDLKAFSATVVTTYATSADTESAIATAKSEAIATASAYTDGEITKVTTAYTEADADLANSINAVSGSVDSFSAAVISTYATSANTVNAIATAKSEAIATASAYTDGQIDAVTSAYTTADAGLASDIETVSGSVNSFSASVVNNYATKVMASGYAMTAEANAVASGKGYTDAVVAAAKKEASDANAATEGKLSNLSGSVKSFSAAVISTYATSANTVNAIATAKSEAISSGKGYTDSQISAVTKNYTDADTKLENKITSLSGSVSALSEELREEIANKVASAYIYKGSVNNVSDLPTEDNVKGDVYNVINANGAPGDDNYTPAGTNYAWDGDKWDALGGVVDLSNYTTTATTNDISTGLTALQSKVNEFSGAVDTKFTEYTVTTAMTELIADAKSEAISSGKGYTDAVVEAAKKEASDANAATEGKLSNLSGSVESFSAAVISTYATSANTESAIATAKSEAIATAKTYTDGQIDAVTSAYTAADAGLASDITKVSGSVKSFSATVVNNYATKVMASGYANTAKSEAIATAKTYTDGEIDAVTSAYTAADAGLASDITKVSGSVKSFSATVVSDYATKVMASGYAMTAEANAVASGKGYTDSQISAVTKGYTDADNALDARIDKLEAISAQTQSAVQSVVVTNTATNKITATKNGTTVTLNFDNMVIDCGEF